MSTLKADTIQNTSGGAVTLTNQSAAKAWVRYSHVTFGINSSFNTSSITDNATGDATVALTNAMSDTTFAVVTGIYALTSVDYNIGYVVASTSNYDLHASSGTSAVDTFNNTGSTLGDLA